MGKKAVKQDLALKGLDARTAVVGPDGLFMAPPEVPNYTEEAIPCATQDETPAQAPTKPPAEDTKSEPKLALSLPVESAKTEKPKTPKGKKTKETVAGDETPVAATQPIEPTE